MKNEFEIRGKVTVIFLRYKGEITTTTISTEDLARVSSIAGRWYAMDVGGKRGEKVYVGAKVGGVTVYLHQVVKMNSPHTVVDHFNHNPLDNTRDNLRVVSYSENAQNRKGAQCNNRSSGYRNVYQNRNGSWFVRLSKKGRVIHVGTYLDVEEANRNAIAARKEHFYSAL